MNTPVATVIATDNHQARVRVAAQLACARCAAGRGCGAGLLGKPSKAREFDVEIPAGMRLSAGDEVQLSMQPRRLLQASLLAYGLPLAALVVLPALAQWQFGPVDDWQLAVIAVGGLAAAVLAGRRLLRREQCLAGFVPCIEQSAGRDQ